jgi:hypothetical protein
MNKILPLIGVAVAASLSGYAAVQLSGAGAAVDEAKVVKPAPKRPSARTAQSTDDQDEPPYKALIRLISDLDDMLDSIVNEETFRTVRPLMLKRVRQHAAEMAENERHMGKLSKEATGELNAALARHATSMGRANKVVPGVADFFSQHLAAAMNQK